MTSRRCIILEEGVRELLELDHYTVQIMPVGYNRHFLPVHLVASRGEGETRYIRIRKAYRKRRTIQTIETMCRNEIRMYRRILARPDTIPGLHCEIWVYTLYSGFHCYEVLIGSLRQIPRLASDTTKPLPEEGAPG